MKLINKLCEPCKVIYKDHMTDIGSKGGSRKSAAKTKAVRKNARLPRKRGGERRKLNARADLPRIEDANRESGCEGNNRG
jgi:hypothetical protein